MAGLVPSSVWKKQHWASQHFWHFNPSWFQVTFSTLNTYKMILTRQERFLPNTKHKKQQSMSQYKLRKPEMGQWRAVAAEQKQASVISPDRRFSAHMDKLGLRTHISPKYADSSEQVLQTHWPLIQEGWWAETRRLKKKNPKQIQENCWGPEKKSQLHRTPYPWNWCCTARMRELIEPTLWSLARGENGFIFPQ